MSSLLSLRLVPRSVAAPAVALVLLFAVSCGPGQAPPEAPVPAADTVSAPPAEPAPAAPDSADPDPGPDPRLLPRVVVDTARVPPPEGWRAARHEPGPLPDPAEWAAGQTGEWTRTALAEMTLREKVGQMIMPWVMGDFAPEGSPGFERLARLIDEHEVGGIIMSVGTPVDVAAKLNTAQQRSRLPLLVAADLETGAGFRMRGAVYLPGLQDLGGATDFPALMALGAADDGALAYEMGRITALEARSVGIHVPFAPVLDVNSNPDNPIINTRSFGEDPERVGELGVCFIRGMQEHGALATGKHFPGHGDTETDSHLALPIIRADRARLDRVELRPFRAAVEGGMGAIMTAHIALPGIAEEGRLPATLSRNVLDRLLRQEWDFQGLVFTDAMDMNAIDRLFGREEAAVRAVLAGADVILMPPSPEAAIRGIMNAVLAGRIPEERIDASVRRILGAKEAMGLHLQRTVDLAEVHRRVGIPAHTVTAEEIARRSLTLLRNERGLLPLRGTRTANVLSVTYRRQNDLMAGRSFDGRLRDTYPRLSTATVGRSTSQSEYQALARRARGSDLVVVSLYVTAVAYGGSVAVPRELSRFIQGLAEARVPHVVISFGNPYLLSEFPEAQSYLLAWSGAQASQRAAARALFGEVAIRGRTPTRIPPSFEIGAGLQLAASAVASAPGAGSRAWPGDCRP